jgi:hypothetical protein
MKVEGGNKKTENTTTASEQFGSDTELKELIKMMKSMMELMMKFQEDANKAKQATAIPSPVWQKSLQLPRSTAAPLPSSRKPKPPPSPCYACGQMHWYQDCPQRPQVQQRKPNNIQNTNQRPGDTASRENFRGPRQ